MILQMFVLRKSLNNCTRHDLMTLYPSVTLISTELIPFAQTGGLGDMLDSLGRSLHSKGVPTSYILPRFSGIDTRSLHQVDVQTKVIHNSEITARIFRGRHPSGIPVYFIDIPNFFDRPALYGEHGEGYPDNAIRFIAFSQFAMEVAKAFTSPNILHCHDWQSAMIPVYIKTLYANDPYWQKIRSLFTIHNLAYQGVFPPSDFAITGIPPSCFSNGFLEFYGQLNMMKGALVTADGITTVSPTYAQEILTPEFGCSLEGLLRSRQTHLRGILNGIVTTEWNPTTDRLLPARYSAKDLSGKKICKQALQKEMNLPVRDDQWVVGMICRLAHQKGVDLAVPAITQLMDQPVQWILLGSGDPHLEESLSQLVAQHPDRVAVSSGFIPQLTHLIEAGSDFFMMPSRYEPCGYNQMYSQHYGTLPIVHNTGGLKDTVTDVSQDPSLGTGFTFQDATSDALRDCILRAIEFCGNRKNMETVMKRAMVRDFSCEKTGEEYVAFYQNLLSSAPSPLPFQYHI